eukprot:8209439-Alexandrium_andersonii.AAC.1
MADCEVPPGSLDRSQDAWMEHRGSALNVGPCIVFVSQMCEFARMRLRVDMSNSPCVSAGL